MTWIPICSQSRTELAGVIEHNLLTRNKYHNLHSWIVLMIRSSWLISTPDVSCQLHPVSHEQPVSHELLFENTSYFHVHWLQARGIQLCIGKHWRHCCKWLYSNQIRPVVRPVRCQKACFGNSHEAQKQLCVARGLCIGDSLKSDNIE